MNIGELMMKFGINVDPTSAKKVEAVLNNVKKSTQNAVKAVQKMSKNLFSKSFDMQGIQKGLNGIKGTLRSVLGLMGIQMGSGLLTSLAPDAIKKSREELTNFFNELLKGSGIADGLNGAIEKATKMLLDLLNKLKPYLQVIIKNAISLINRIRTQIERMVKPLKEIIEKLGGAENFLRILAVAVGTLWALMNFDKIIKAIGTIMKLLNPVNLLLVAIVLMVEDFFAFMQGKDSLIGRALEEMGIDLDDARQKVNDFFQMFKDVLPEIREVAKALGGKFMQTLKDKIIPTVIKLAQKCEPLIKDILDKLPDLLESIGGAMIDIMPTITDIVSKILPRVLDLVDKIMPIVQKFCDEVLPPLLELIENLVDPLLDIVETILDPILEILDEMMPVIGDIIGDEGLSALSPILEGIQAFLEPVMEAIKSLVEKLLPKIKPLLEALQPLLEVIGELLGVVGEVLGGIIDAVSFLVGGALDGLTAGLNWVFGGGLTEVDNKVQEATKGYRESNTAKMEKAGVSEYQATGTESAPDAFIAGEQGAELVVGQKGKKVFNAFSTDKIMSALTALQGTASASGVVNNSGHNVNQTVNITNNFTGGDATAQAQGAKAMDKSARSATDYMANALSFGR